MKQLFFIAAFLVLGISMTAQTHLDRQVIASQGASDRTEHIRLDWTLGEPAVATLTTSSGFLTEGFQQPVLRVEALTLPGVAAKTVYDIRVAPNPTSSLLSIQFPTALQEELGWELLDLTGKMLQRRTPSTPSDQQIDVSMYPDGMYLLRFSNLQGKLVQTYRIVKTH